MSDTKKRVSRKTEKPLVFPRMRKFSQLFDGVEKYDHSNPKSDRTGLYRFSRWCTHIKLRSQRWLSVTPKQKTIEKIASGLVVDGSLYWEFIDWGDNRTLVVVHYDRILGNRWVALIDTDSIPRIRKAATQRKQVQK